jgi:DNA-binding GntR family transcriptional regulator
VTAEQMLAKALEQHPFAPPPTRSLLREEVYESMRSWIITGVLPPGARLRDTDIADALSISRTPVREAIRRLQDEGLVVAAASRWTKVAPVDVKAADDLYPITWTLERLALSLAKHWDAGRIGALRAANDRLADALDAGDASAASDADTDFHRHVVEAAGNDELSVMIERLKMRLRRIEIAYFDGQMAGRRSVLEHDAVITALEAGDIETAGAEIENNWRSSLTRMHERLAGAPAAGTPAETQ